MNYNADCLIVASDSNLIGGFGGQVTVTESEAADAVRCSMLPVSTRTATGLAGELGLLLYSVRLHTTAPVAVDWRVLLRQDGSDQYLSYMVRDARPNAWGHTHLTVERV